MTSSGRTTVAEAADRQTTWPWDRIVSLARALGNAIRGGIAGAQLGTLDEVEIGRKTGARR
jgi:hypothetical protein